MSWPVSMELSCLISMCLISSNSLEGLVSKGTGLLQEPGQRVSPNPEMDGVAAGTPSGFRRAHPFWGCCRNSYGDEALDLVERNALLLDSVETHPYIPIPMYIRAAHTHTYPYPCMHVSRPGRGGGAPR